jgi:hypothetical protein
LFLSTHSSDTDVLKNYGHDNRNQRIAHLLEKVAADSKDTQQPKSEYSVIDAVYAGRGDGYDQDVVGRLRNCTMTGQSRNDQPDAAYGHTDVTDAADWDTTGDSRRNFVIATPLGTIYKCGQG